MKRQFQARSTRWSAICHGGVVLGLDAAYCPTVKLDANAVIAVLFLLPVASLFRIAKARGLLHWCINTNILIQDEDGVPLAAAVDASDGHEASARRVHGSLACCQLSGPHSRFTSIKRVDGFLRQIDTVVTKMNLVPWIELSTD